MKIVDFDRKFFEFARKWMLAHPGLTEEQVEDSYNQMMEEWIAAPADWLDGVCPGEYFRAFEDADELIGGMKAYFEAGITIPEPLYSRIVELDEACAPRLRELIRNENLGEEIRAEAMGMLRDMDSTIADAQLLEMVCSAESSNELSDLAADILTGRDERMVAPLLDAYPGAPEYAQMLILDICSNFPGDPRIYDYLVHRLKNDSEHRALWACCLGKLGDERAVEILRSMLDMTDLRYLDYIELRAAVEALGGDAGEERSFYGDPDFEALRSL